MKKNKILVFILMIAIVFTSFPMCSVIATGATAISTDSQISTEMVYAKRNTTVEVGIRIKNNPGILSMTLKIDYDESKIKLCNIENGDALSYLDFTVPKNLNSGCMLPWDSESIKPEDITVKSGTVAVLTFEILDTANENDNIAINVSPVGTILNNDLDVLLIDFVSGGIYVLNYIPGDVNGDGIVSSADVTFLRRSIAGGYGVTIDEAAADVNGDGIINSNDVVYIRRYIAGGYGIALMPSTLVCNHSMQHISAKAATCTEDGNIEYWYCDECGKYFSDAEGKTEITANETVLAQTGHMEVIDAAVSPTYDSTGLTEGSHCSKCGKILKNQDVIPKLEATYHSIIYKDTKGAEIPVDKMRYSEHEGLLDLPVISADGYTFKGWYTASEGGTKVDHIIKGSNEDKVLYAHWELVKYTITYKDAPIKNNQSEFTIEDEIVLNDPEWFGLAFKNWTDDNGNVVTKISKGTIGNITITANWMSERNLAIPSNSTKAKAILFDEKVGRYYFIYDIGTIENIILSTLKTDDKGTGESLNWTIKETEVEESSVAKTIAKTVSTSVSQTNGWSKTREWTISHSESISSSITAGLEVEEFGLKAKLEATIGATSSTGVTGSREYGTSGNNSTGSETSDSVSSTVSYKKGMSTTIENTITVPSEMPKGKYSYVYAGKVYVYAVVTYDPIERNYYVDTFSIMDDNIYGKRIYDAPANTTANITSSEGLSLNVENYEDEIQTYIDSVYTVQYDANGGEGEMYKSLHKVGEKSTLQSNSFSRAGYVFTGWGISSNGGALYPDNAEITDIAEKGTSITLYAIWSAKKYKVIFDVNGGDALYPDTYDVTYDATYGTLPSPVRAGYSFDGWYLGNEKIDSESIVKIAGQHTLIAKWKPIVTTVIDKTIRTGESKLAGSGAKLTNQISPSSSFADLYAIGYRKIKLTFTYDIKEVDDCYQTIRIRNSNTTFSENKFSHGGFERYTGAEGIFGKNYGDHSWGTYSLTVEIDLVTLINDKLYFEVQAENATFRDFFVGTVTVYATVSPESME